jgi:hypothetical protein
METNKSDAAVGKPGTKENDLMKPLTSKNFSGLAWHKKKVASARLWMRYAIFHSTVN